MRALFIYDTRIKYENNIIKTSGTINEIVFQKYLKYFDEIKVITREETRLGIKLKTEIKNDRIKAMTTSNLKSIYYFKKIKEVKLSLSEEIKKTDFVIIRMPSINGKIAIDICNKYNKKYLVEFVGCPYDAMKKEFFPIGFLYAIYELISNKNYLKKSKNVIYVTDKFLQQRYPTNYNSIGCSDVILRENIRNRKIQVKNKKYITIGLIGNYYKGYKGIETALKCIKEIKKRDIKVILKIVGNGNKSKYFKYIKKNNLEENIVFEGVKKSGDDIDQWLNSIDIYIQPSYQEGMPRAVIEAMNKSCPIVASNVGGIPEIIKKDFLHEPGDYKRMSELIINFIKNEEYAYLQGTENYKNSKRFSEKTLNEKRDIFLNNIFK